MGGPDKGTSRPWSTLTSRTSGPHVVVPGRTTPPPPSVPILVGLGVPVVGLDNLSGPHRVWWSLGRLLRGSRQGPVFQR